MTRIIIETDDPDVLIRPRTDVRPINERKGLEDSYFIMSNSLGQDDIRTIGAGYDLRHGNYAGVRRTVNRFNNPGVDISDSLVFEEPKRDSKLDQRLEPCEITDDMLVEVRLITEGCTSEINKAHAIYQWMKQNIPYDNEARRRIDNEEYRKYRTAKETYNDGTGVCGEQAILYIALAKAVGLKARYVKIKKDNHAIAEVTTKSGHKLYIDTTRENGFGYEYKDQETLSDELLDTEFNGWNYDRTHLAAYAPRKTRNFKKAAIIAFAALIALGYAKSYVDKFTKSAQIHQSKH